MGKTGNKLFWGLFLGFLRQKERTAIQLFRIKAATAYVKGVQGARLAFLGYLAVAVLIVIFTAGFILLHVGLYHYLDWPVQSKALLLMVLGGIYFVIPLLVFCVMARPRLWMRCSGADEIVDRALRGEPLSEE